MEITEKQHKRISKKLALVLRHRPEVFGLKPDERGWCSVEEVLAGFRDSELPVSRTVLEQVPPRFLQQII